MKKWISNKILGVQPAVLLKDETSLVLSINIMKIPFLGTSEGVFQRCFYEKVF